MRRFFPLAVYVCVAAVFAGSAALAQVETTPIPMTAKPNFSSMRFLVGTWNCTESNTRRAAPYKNTLTTTMDSTGYWLNTRTVSHATSWQPADSILMDKVTYDAPNSRWVDVGTDDQGNYAMSTSAGWKGPKIVWRPVSLTSVSSGNVVSSGDNTITKISASKYTYVTSFKESGGRVVSVKGTCTKGS